MKNEVFVMWGEGSRGTDTLFGKEWKEGSMEKNTIKEVLLNNFNGLYGVDGLDDYMDDCLDEEDGVMYFTDDWGNYVYIGRTKKEVVDLWIKYT